jgi:DNA invertase Pin-like site-specific DNA recombinase
MIESDPLDLPASETDIMSKNKLPALAYLRTSSAANVGEDKDSDKRQLLAIEAYARRNNLEIVQPPTYDAAVSGADAIEGRPGFSRMMAYLAAHPECRTILVENVTRFARDLMVQEVGYRILLDQGIALIPVDAPTHFTDSSPTAVMVRQILGAVSQFQKAMTVLQLRMARERKKAATGKKVGGRRSHLEQHPEAVALAKSLRWVNKRMQEKRTLREIADELAKRGHVASSGKPYGPSAISSMLEG